MISISNVSVKEDSGNYILYDNTSLDDPAVELKSDDIVITIKDDSELEKFSSIVNGTTDLGPSHNFFGYTVILVNNIDLSTTDNFDPIGKNGNKDGSNYTRTFEGTFDGQEFEISNITVNASSTESNITYAGLFGYIGPNGTVMNVGVVNTLITSDLANSNAYAGGIAGWNEGAIISCYNIGIVNASPTTTESTNFNAYAGGIVGWNEGKITNCYNTGKVGATTESTSSYAYAGGIAGQNGSNATISYCYNTGDVSATATATATATESTSSYAYAGGIAGQNGSNATISYCYNTGKVEATAKSTSSYAYAGGIVGWNNGTIENCYNAEVVSATTTTGSTSSRACAGGIVGYNYGDSATISNCYNTGDVKAEASSRAYAGGIVGSNGDSTSAPQVPGGLISNCYNAGDVTSTSTNSGTYAGGIAGYSNATISYCYNTGDVSATTESTSAWIYAYAGGIAGQNYGSSATITNCYNAGDVSATTTGSTSSSAYAGGIVGWNYGTISNCYNAGDVIATTTESTYSRAYAGGIAGQNGSNATISYCYNTGDVIATTTESTSSSAYAGGIAGSNATISYCYNAGDVIATTESTNSYASAGGIVGQTGAAISYCYNTGDVIATTTESTSVWIYASAGGIAGYSSSSVSITNCYNAGDVSAESTSSWAYAGGIVGCSNAAITNCYNAGDVTSTSTNSIAYSGGIVGYSDAAITNCYNAGDVTSTSTFSDAYVGGIAGENYDSSATISNCYNTGNVSAESTSSWAYAGGIVGYSNAAISYCYNTGKVEATSKDNQSRAGGIVGLNGGNASISNCYNAGDVKAEARSSACAGGIIGYDSVGSVTISISNCYNTGRVDAISEILEARAGGIAGAAHGNLVSNCYNAGDVSANATGAGSSARAGGIAGQSQKNLSNCYNTGDVTATVTYTISEGYSWAFAGGIVGRIENEPTIENCYNTGDVSAESTNSNAYAGGIAGGTGTSKNVSHRCPPITNCYNTGDVSAKSASPNACAGGIIGSNGDFTSNEYGGPITNCYNIGNVTAKSTSPSAFAGGIAGYNHINDKATITNCYYLNTAIIASAGNNLSPLGVGKPSSEMQSSDFVNDLNGSDPDKPWTTNSSINNGYPILESIDPSKHTFLNGSDPDGPWIEDPGSINNGHPILESLNPSNPTSDFLNGSDPDGPWIEDTENINNGHPILIGPNNLFLNGGIADGPWVEDTEGTNNGHPILIGPKHIFLNTAADGTTKNNWSPDIFNVNEGHPILAYTPTSTVKGKAVPHASLYLISDDEHSQSENYLRMKIVSNKAYLEVGYLNFDNTKYEIGEYKWYKLTKSEWELLTETGNTLDISTYGNGTYYVQIKFVEISEELDTQSTLALEPINSESLENGAPTHIYSSLSRTVSLETDVSLDGICKLTYISGDASLEIVYDLGEEATVIYNPFTNNDKTFVGWALESGGEVNEDHAPGNTILVTKKNLELYAVYAEGDAYSIYYYYLDDRNTVKEVSVSESNNAEGAPTKSGYTFQNWLMYKFGEPTLLREVGAGAPIGDIDSDILMIANWEKQSGNGQTIISKETYYSVVYVSDSDYSNVPSAEQYPSSTLVTIKNNNLTKEGFTPNGWNTIADGSGKTYAGGTSEIIYSNLVLYAQFTKNSTVDPSDPDNPGGSGTVDPSDPDNPGGSGTVDPSDPDNPGGSGTGDPSDPDNPGSSKEEVNIIFYVDGKEYITITIDEGSTLGDKIPSDPEKENSTFEGWYTSEGDKLTKDDIVDQNTTVYAKWKSHEDNYSWLWLLAFLILLLLIPIALRKRVEFYLNEDDEDTYEVVETMGKKLGDKLPQIRKEDFVEWYTIIDEKETIVNENTQIKDGMKVFAKWK